MGRGVVGSCIHCGKSAGDGRKTEACLRDSDEGGERSGKSEGAGEVEGEKGVGEVEGEV